MAQAVTAPGTLSLRARIGPTWERSEGQTVADRNPARPDEVVATAPAGDVATARRALEAARSALPAWARTQAPARGEILFRAAELLTDRATEIGRDLCREQGKTLSEAIGEVRRAAQILRYFAGVTLQPEGEIHSSSVPGTRIWVIGQPVGVVALVTPWNFPIAIPAWKIGPALAFGNTVILKPASATPLSAFRLVEALVDAGVPDGVVNLAYVSGAAAESAWLRDGGVDAISFTGSTAVGTRVREHAAAAGIRSQLELGGKNAVVVAEDADLDAAADAIARGAFASAGQKCTATSRVIAVEPVARALEERLAERVRALVPGDPLHPSTTLGPVIDESARGRVLAAVDRAVTEGCRVVARGEVPEVGWYAPPVVLADVRPEHAIAQEEVFGPVVGILVAADLDDALRIHDSVAFGLSASIFTRDIATAHRFAVAARAGVVHVNGETAGAEAHVPFGGIKASSWGPPEQGSAARAFYTQSKTVYWDNGTPTGLFDAVGRRPDPNA